MNAVIIRMAAAALAAARRRACWSSRALPPCCGPTSPAAPCSPTTTAARWPQRPPSAAPMPRPSDPAVDLTDPEAVARAYLVAAHSLVPGDAGHTQRRAAGVRPAGQPGGRRRRRARSAAPAPTARAVVTGLEPAGADGERRGYRAALRTATARPGGPVAAARQQALVVLARSPDGRWRVVAETTGDHPDLPAGED